MAHVMRVVSIAAMLALSTHPTATRADWNGGGTTSDSMVATAVDGTAYVTHWGGCASASADLGLTWSPIACPPGTNSIDSLIVDAPGWMIVNATASDGSGSALYKSLDGGVTWFPIPLTDERPGEAIQAFAGGSGGLYVRTNQRTLRSDDGGAHWTAIGGGLSGANSDVIAVSPLDFKTVFVATYDGTEFPIDTRQAVGVFKSVDGGQTFARSDAGITSLVRAIAFHPTRPNIVFAGSNGAGIFKSADGGATWAPANTGLTASYVARTFAFSPWNPDVVYVSTWDAGVWVSEDAGAHWTSLGLTGHNVSSIATQRGGAVGSYRLYATTTHAGTHVMIRTPTTVDVPAAPQLAWVGGASGVGSSMVAATGAPGRAYQSSWNGCLFSTTTSGTTWDALPCPGSGPGVDSVVASQTDPAAAYAVTATGVFRTANGGQSWSAVGPALSSAGPEWIQAFAVAPSDWARLYVHTNQRMLRSTDGGTNWSAAGLGLAGANTDFIAVDPSHPDTVFTATYDGLEFPLDTRVAVGLYKSTDGGRTFTRSDAGLTSLVRALAFHPTNPSILFAGSNGGGVYRSTDGGATWAPSNDGLTARYVARTFAFSPLNASTVYVATWDDGPYVSEDAGLSWAPLWNGLLSANVSSVATVSGAAAGSYRLLAATTTRGTFALDRTIAAGSGTAVSTVTPAGSTLGVAVAGAPGATLLGVESVAADDISLDQTNRPAGYAFDHGAVRYRVVGIVPGATALVQLTYPSPLPAGSKVFEITSSGFAELAGATIGGSSISLTLVDGGQGDADGRANGVIVNAVAVGVPRSSPPPPPPPASGGKSGCSSSGGEGQALLLAMGLCAWLLRSTARRRAGERAPK